MIEAFSICTIASAVCSYYWSRPDASGKRNFAKYPILTGLYRCFRFHFGSLCFGSLIIAIVQFIRAILAYIDHNTKELQQSNILIKIFMKVVQCLMWCFEKILKFISKNAYILIAMKGNSFCTSTFNAFSIILGNLARVGTVSFISIFVLLLCKVSVSVASAVITYQILSSYADYGVGGSKQLSNVFIPVIFTFIIGYTISSIALGVYETTIDTILVCFCEDATVNDGGEVYMSPELASYISKHSVQADGATPAKNGGAAPAKQTPAPQGGHQDGKDPEKGLQWGAKDSD